jgi:hypothetical protein
MQRTPNLLYKETTKIMKHLKINKDCKQALETMISNVSACEDINTIKYTVINFVSYLLSYYSAATTRTRLTEIRKYVKTRHIDVWNKSSYFLLVPKDVNIKINRQSKRTKAKYQNNVIRIDSDTAQKIVQDAQSMLSSNDRLTLTIALCLLTGRRETEVLKTANFTKYDDDSLKFEGQLKKRDDEQSTCVIPSLCPPQQIIEAHNRLKQSLRRTHDIDNMSNDDINTTFSSSLRRKTIAYLNKYIQNEKLSTHDLRKVYAAICVYKYNPIQQGVNANAFLSKILGHSEDDTDTAGTYQRFYIMQK